jgi:hypothetical protein
VYEKWSTTHPVDRVKIIAPRPAAVPAKPAIEPTASTAKKSPGSVCTLPTQNWNPNRVTLMQARAWTGDAT